MTRTFDELSKAIARTPSPELLRRIEEDSAKLARYEMPRLQQMLGKGLKRRRFFSLGIATALFAWLKPLTSIFASDKLFIIDSEPSPLVNNASFFKGDTIVEKMLDAEREFGAKDSHIQFMKSVLDYIAGKVKSDKRMTEGEAKQALAMIAVCLVEKDFKYKETDMVFEHLDEPCLDCDTFSFVYLSIGERCGFPIRAVYLPEHVFVRWMLPEGKYINWETTTAHSAKVSSALIEVTQDLQVQCLVSNCIKADSEIISTNKMVDKDIGTKYMLSLSPDQVLSIHLKKVYLTESSKYSKEARKAFKESSKEFDKYDFIDLSAKAEILHLMDEALRLIGMLLMAVDSHEGKEMHESYAGFRERVASAYPIWEWHCLSEAAQTHEKALEKFNGCNDRMVIDYPDGSNVKYMRKQDADRVLDLLKQAIDTLSDKPQEPVSKPRERLLFEYKGFREMVLAYRDYEEYNALEESMKLCREAKSLLDAVEADNKKSKVPTITSQEKKSKIYGILSEAVAKIDALPNSANMAYAKLYRNNCTKIVDDADNTFEFEYINKAQVLLEDTRVEYNGTKRMKTTTGSDVAYYMDEEAKSRLLTLLKSALECLDSGKKGAKYYNFDKPAKECKEFMNEVNGYKPLSQMPK